MRQTINKNHKGNKLYYIRKDRTAIEKERWGRGEKKQGKKKSAMEVRNILEIIL